MRIPRLFVETALSVDAVVRIDGPPAHYLKNVLRTRIGSRVILFNGQGGQYTAEVTQMDRQAVRLHIDEFSEDDRESPLLISMGMAVTKRDAMDNAIQKATELGVSHIYPLMTNFTDPPGRAIAGRHVHWQQITRSACEQCERNRPPRLHEAINLKTWLDTVTADVRLVAHPDGDTHMDDLGERVERIGLLTGPEGGFSDREIALCREHDVKVVGLGPRILRADTAPVVLLTLVQYRFGDLLAPN